MAHQSKPVAYPPGMLPRVLDVASSRARAWREEADPFPDRKAYSRRDIFAHFILKYFIYEMDRKSKDVNACDWSQVFIECNERSFKTLRGCRVIANFSNNTVQIVSKSVSFDRDNPKLHVACLDRVYKKFVAGMINDFPEPKNTVGTTKFTQYMK